MSDQDKTHLMQAIVGYLSSVNTGIKVKGKKEDVDSFMTSLDNLKSVLDNLELKENIQEAKKSGAWKMLMTGIVGYLLGKGSKVKVKGDPKQVEKLTSAIKKLSNTIKDIQSPQRKW